MPRMPMKLATVLIVVASLLLPVALVAVWAARTLGDTDRYTAEMSAVAADPAVQDALGTRLSAAIDNTIDGSRLDQALTSLLEGRDTNPLIQQGLLALGDAARQRLVDRIDTRVDEFVHREDFGVAWTQLNRAAHQQLVTVLEGGDSPLLAADGSLSLDLAPLVSKVLGGLDQQVLKWLVPVPAGAVSVTIMSGADVQTAQGAYGLLTSLALWVPIVWVLLVAVTLVLSRDRRRALTWLAVGSAVGAAVVLGGLWYAHGQVAANIANPQDAVIADSIVSNVSAGLSTVAVGIVIIALVVILVTRLSVSFSRSRATAAAGSAR